MYYILQSCDKKYQVKGWGLKLCLYLLLIWRPQHLFYCARYFNTFMNGGEYMMIVDCSSLVRLTNPQKGSLIRPISMINGGWVRCLLCTTRAQWWTSNRLRAMSLLLLTAVHSDNSTFIILACRQQAIQYVLF